VKTKKFKAIVMLGMLLLSVGCIGQTKASSLKDFSIALYEMERGEKETTLYFTITKISEVKSDFIFQPPKTKEEYEAQLIQVPITLTDDHENKYDGKLQIDLDYEYGGGFFINYFPKGFTYIDTVRIRIPEIAPIEKVIVGDKEIPFKKAKFAKPKFLKEFGNFTGIKGQEVQVGKWLSFTIGEKILPGGRVWWIPLIIENGDYNPLSIDMIYGTQLHDGRISWHNSSGYHQKVKGLSKFSDKLEIVNMQYCGYTKEFTHPRAFIVMGINESTLEASLRIFPLTPNEFPSMKIRILLNQYYKVHTLEDGTRVCDVYYKVENKGGPGSYRLDAEIKLAKPKPEDWKRTWKSINVPTEGEDIAEGYVRFLLKAEDEVVGSSVKVFDDE